jgi:pyruvate formate lyase activating enzyme
MVRGPAPFLSGVTVSGGEATLQAPFVRDFFAALKDDARLARLSRFVDSNGVRAAEVWDDLDPVMDGR